MPAEPVQVPLFSGFITRSEHREFGLLYPSCFTKDRLQKHTLIRMPLKELSARLPENQFARIHRSHIVNLAWVDGVKRVGRQVQLTMKHGDFELPVSRYRLPQLLPILEKFLNPDTSRQAN